MSCILLCSFLSPLSISAQDSEIKGDLVNVVTENSRPNWITLNPDANLNPKAFINLLNNGSSFAEGSTVDLTGQSKDKKGQTRHIYQQYYKLIPIDNYLWVLHEADGVVNIAQGTFFEQPPNPDPIPVLNSDQALRIALETINANQYAWEVPALEQDLQTIKDDPNATYYPQANLVWVEEETGGALKLAYKFDIYAVDPVSRKEYFVDAKTGHFIRSLDVLFGNCFGESPEKHAKHNHHRIIENANLNTTIFADSAGTGIANYITASGGVVDLTTDYNGTNFTLTTSGLGPLGTQAIQTKNANNYWNYNHLTDFENVDNHWASNPTAVGAHWGATQSYQYFLDTFSRNSYDDAGATVLTIAHYGSNLVNAYWDGTRMIFGDGNGTSWSALTSLDIIAHEFTHAVTENNGTGGLVYLDESGALNESFSDIFGAVVEQLYHPDGGNWLIGEDFDLANQVGFRNMADPNTAGHPKTYLGLHWFDGAGDNGGVHSNSGVQNYWFYLLTAGGSGTNEFGLAYDILPIGLQKAAAISYYNLTHYMTPNATYEDAMNGSINAAQILYPNDMAVQTAVADAWCAVGLGNGCGPTIIVNEPIANEVVTAGQDYVVTWSNTLLSATSKVKIEYTTETETNPVWHLITDNLANTGTYNWLVPSDYSNTVRVRVTDDGDPATGRVSNSDILGISSTFEIGACNATNSFTAPTTGTIDEALSFTGNIIGDAYQWKIDGIEVGTSQDLNYTFSEAGIYEVTYRVTATAANCFNEESRKLYVLQDNSSGFALQVGDIDNGGGRAYSQEILQTTDGGYIFVSIFTGRVYKVDALGATVWSSTAFPELSYPNYRASAVEKSDKNILIVLGFSPSSGTVEDDNLLIIEVDGTNGSIINNTSKQLISTGRLMPFQIIATDTSYIISGAYQNNGAQNLFLVQLKAVDFSILNQVWIGDATRSDYYGDLIQTSDGGLLFGWTQSGVYPEYFNLLKLDGNFQEEWKEGLYSYTARAGSRSRMELLEIPNCGGYMVLADANEYANSTLVHINVLGNIQWAKRYSTPDALDGALISFQDMVWDGNNGITLLGINGTALNSNNYPTSVDYQLINVSFDGQLNWKRKINDLNVIIPSGPSYNLFTMDLLATADGGYLAAIPGADGGETHLIKTDSMGIDGCVMGNTNINEEDITSTFNIALSIIDTLANPPVIQSAADYPFNIGAPNVTISAPKCGNIGNDLIAAYSADNFTILVNTSPVITNLSRGATSESWKVDGSVVSFPLPNFTNTGVYEVMLEVTDGTTTSSIIYDFNVVDENGCELPCDLVKEEGRIIETSCPDTEDAEVITSASSVIGRNLYYELYDGNNNLLVSQTHGRFTGLAIGDYQVIAKSINDASCELDLGTYTVVPKVDNNPPQANCVSNAVDAAFVHAAVGLPYNHPNYIQEMDAVFGAAWHQLTYEGVNPQQLFSDSYNFIFLEGTANNANELEAFLETNQQLIEDWVAAGNALFLNAGPNEGDGMSFGFGGVQLVRGTYDSAFAVTPTLPMFNGPLTPVLTAYGGTFSLGAVIIPPDMDTTRILAAQNGTDLLVQANWGAGKVLFGGMNLTGFHTPQAESLKFRRNILHHLKSLPIATINSPMVIALDEKQTYNLAVNEIDLGSFDDCGLLSVELDTSKFNCENIGILDIALIVTDVANNVSTCTTQIEIIDTTKTQIIATICKGESYDFDNEPIMVSGVFQSTLQNNLGCDSLVELTLTVIDTSQTPIMASICQGETYSFNNQEITEAGVYRDTLQNSNACDSFLVLTLTVLDTAQTPIMASICQGETYSFNNQELREVGIYRDTLKNSNACDSFIVLTLTVTACNGPCTEEEMVINENLVPENHYKAGISITSAGIIGSGTTIYQAGDVIHLLPGFHATAGNNFTAIIEPTTCEESSNFNTEKAPNPTVNLSASTIPYFLKNELLVSPNPFYQTTKIDFKIASPQNVKLAIYSIDGQLISVLQKGGLPAGNHTKFFDGGVHKGGMYFVVLQTAKSVLTKKIIRLE